MKKIRWQARIRSLGLLAVLSIAATTVAGAAQNAQDPQNQVSGNWTVRCVSREGAPPCDMFQIVSDKNSHQPLMIFSIGHAGRQEQYGLQIRVPLGVLISGGAVIRIDNKAEIKELKFTRCTSTGCLIEARLDPAKLQPFRQGGRGFLAVLDGRGKPLLFPISLNGFTGAIDSMTAKNQAWAKTANNPTKN